MSTTAMQDTIKAWDEAWSKCDAQEMQQHLADDVCLHADGVLLHEDLKGKDAVTGNFKRYFELYDFDHTCLLTATNGDNKSAFGMWQDSSKKAEDKAKETVAGMWRIVLDSNNKITDIYFLRQMHQVEKDKRLKDTSAILSGGLEHDMCTKSPDMSKAKEDFPKKLREIAELYSGIWQHPGRVHEIADEICKPNLRSKDIFKGGELSSMEDFKKMVEETHEHWTPESTELDIAVNEDDNKAFVFWSSTGKIKDKEGTVKTFGLNMLEVDPEDHKIIRSSGFRQLMPNEVEQLLKPGGHEAKIASPSPASS